MKASIYIGNLKFLLPEIYKLLNGLSPPIMNKVFQTNDCSYDLGNPRMLASKHRSATKYGINTIAYKGPQIWQNIPLETRITSSFQIEFKTDRELTLSLQDLPNLGYTD